jgi:hypothetical protein
MKLTCWWAVSQSWILQDKIRLAVRAVSHWGYVEGEVGKSLLKIGNQGSRMNRKVAKMCYVALFNALGKRVLKAERSTVAKY